MVLRKAILPLLTEPLSVQPASAGQAGRWSPSFVILGDRTPVLKERCPALASFVGGAHCSLPSPHSLPCWRPIRAVVYLFPVSHPVTVRPNLMQSLLCVSSSCSTWNLLAHVGLLGFLLTAELYGPVPLPHTEWPSCSHGGRPA